MGASADLVNSGYGGYAGWGDAAAQADFNATKGNGKFTGGGGSNGGGFQQVKAPDLSAIEDKVYNQLKPYYMQLLTESNGDLKRATDILHQDYQKGVRVAGEDYSRNLGYDMGDLKNQLDSLGITFQNEQESKVDDLNKRGMAVYDQDPNGATNALGVKLPNGGSYNPASANLANYNPNSPDQSGMGAYNPMGNLNNLGRGGVELDRLAQDQALRQEALQRSQNQRIQGLGIDLKRYTNPGATDPSQMGTAENTLNRGIDQSTRDAQTRAEGLYQQLGQNTLNLSTGFANSGVDASKANVANLYNTDQQKTFVNSGV